MRGLLALQVNFPPLKFGSGAVPASIIRRLVNPVARPLEEGVETGRSPNVEAPVRWREREALLA
jgi:hypothetical protein